MVRMPEAMTTNKERGPAGPGNERGVALIIVLLVTALLIALIFEFAYGTRISLRAAVNFRDSQRAAYLARSGVNFVGRYLASNLRTDSTGSSRKYDDVERDWQTVPFIPGTDTVLKVKWEDEAAKIRVTDAQTSTLRQSLLSALFENKGIDRAVLGKMTESTSGINKMSLLTGLHQFMNDEEYSKVNQFLTVNSRVSNVNINTAPEDVLLSFGISQAAISLIVDDRKKAPITDYTHHPAIKGLLINTSLVSNFLTDTTNEFKVYSYATVGGYTKQVEAVLTRSASGFTVSYWRSL